MSFLRGLSESPEYAARVASAREAAVAWAKTTYGPTDWPRWYRMPQPPLPPTADDCEGYARYMCEFGQNARGATSPGNVPECAAAILDRCRELVGRVSSGSISQTAQMVAEQRISYTAADAAREPAMHTPAVAAVVEEALTSEARALASGASPWFRRVAVVASVAAGAWLFWRWRRGRRRAG